MRIAILGHSLIHPRQWLQAMEFERQGHEVLAVCPAQWPSHQFKLHPSEIGASDYQRIGVTVRIAPFAEVPSQIYCYYLDCEKELDQFKPDWLYLLTEPCSAQSAWARRYAQRTGTKLAVFTWENIVQSYPSVFNQWQKLVLGEEGADLVLCGNYAAWQIMERLRDCPQQKLRLIPHCGVDLNAFRLLESVDLPLAHTGYDLVFVGRFTEEKGVREIQYAAKEESLDILWVGEGPLRPEYGDIASYTDYLQLYRIYHAGKVVIQHPKPIEGWQEQCGYVSLEALACGQPVISTTSGSIPEFLGDCVSAFLVEPGNVEVLRQVMSHCAELSGSQYYSYRRQAQQYIQEWYSTEVIARETIDYFEQVS